MGCASSQPESHTKKPLNPQNSNSKNPLPNVQTQQTKPISNNLPNPNVKQPHNSNIRNSNLSDLQKNSKVTNPVEPLKERTQLTENEAIKLNNSQQRQVYESSNLNQRVQDANKIDFSKINSDKKENLQNTQGNLAGDKYTGSNQNKAISQIKQAKTFEEGHISTLKKQSPRQDYKKDLSEVKEAMQEQTPIKALSELRKPNQVSEFKSNHDSAIKEHENTFKQSQNRREPLRIDVQQKQLPKQSEGSVIRESLGIPQMNEEKHMLSRISQEKRRTAEKENGFSNSNNGFSGNKNRIEENNFEQKRNTFQESRYNSEKKNHYAQNNAITDEQIRLNIAANDLSGIYDINDEQFAVLGEENFDLGCGFNPQALTIDMNKVHW